MSTIAVNRFPNLGAEIVGIDKEHLLHDDELPRTVLDALEDNGVVVFRGLHIDDETQAAFCRRLGEIVNTSGEVPGVSVVSLDPTKSASAEYLKGTFDWHIDGATQRVPPNKATCLTAHVITDKGDGTEFASTYAAYEELSDEDKERFASMRVLHSVEATQRLVYSDPTPEQEVSWSQMSRTEHPLVWQHRSGRRSLVLGGTALSIVGMDDDKGRVLLAELVEWATRPGRVYRHLWSEGDTVLWDNLGVLHRALRYEETSARELHRTTLVGDELIE